MFSELNSREVRFAIHLPSTWQPLLVNLLTPLARTTQVQPSELHNIYEHSWVLSMVLIKVILQFFDASTGRISIFRGISAVIHGLDTCGGIN